MALDVKSAEITIWEEDGAYHLNICLCNTDKLRFAEDSAPIFNQILGSDRYRELMEQYIKDHLGEIPEDVKHCFCEDVEKIAPNLIKYAQQHEIWNRVAHRVGVLPYWFFSFCMKQIEPELRGETFAKFNEAFAKIRVYEPYRG